MGQYHVVVNLDRREYLNPVRLGDGLKLAEQVCTYGGTAAALMLLLACSAKGRGGGDVDDGHALVERDGTYAWEVVDPEWHRRVHEWVGRWAGQRIAVVGDYAEDGDLPLQPSDPPARAIYDECLRGGSFRDITAEIVPILERFCRVEIREDREFSDIYHRRYAGPGSGPPLRVLTPDMVVMSRGVGQPPAIDRAPFYPVSGTPALQPTAPEPAEEREGQPLVSGYRRRRSTQRSRA